MTSCSTLAQRSRIDGLFPFKVQEHGGERKKEREGRRGDKAEDAHFMEKEMKRE